MKEEVGFSADGASYNNRGERVSLWAYVSSTGCFGIVVIDDVFQLLFVCGWYLAAFRGDICCKCC
jgi:hypothetical protein